MLKHISFSFEMNQRVKKRFHRHSFQFLPCPLKPWWVIKVSPWQLFTSGIPSTERWWYNLFYKQPVWLFNLSRPAKRKFTVVVNLWWKEDMLTGQLTPYVVNDHLRKILLPPTFTVLLQGIMDYSKQLRYASPVRKFRWTRSILSKNISPRGQINTINLFKKDTVSNLKTRCNWCAVAISISEPLKFTDWSSTIELYKKFPGYFAFKMRKVHILTTNIWYF